MEKETEKGLQIIQPDVPQTITSTANLSLLDNLTSLESMMNFAKVIADSKIVPQYDKPEKIVACLLWAKDNGVPSMSALTGTAFISGKVGADAKLQRAMMLKNNILHKTIEDYRPLYSYQRQDAVFTQDDIDANPGSFGIYFSMASLSAAAGAGTADKTKTNVVRNDTPYDYRTMIEFTRTLGKTVMKETVSFLFSEAVQMGLATKDNWVKMPRAMMYARCYSRGAVRIGADAVNGMYTKEELDSDTEYEIID